MKYFAGIIALSFALCVLAMPAEAKHKKNADSEGTQAERDPTHIEIDGQKINLYCLQSLEELDRDNPLQSIDLDQCQGAPLKQDGWPCAKQFNYCDQSEKQLKNCIHENDLPYSFCIPITAKGKPGSFSCAQPLEECSGDDAPSGWYTAQYIGKIGDIHFVSVNWSGGGTGHFDEIMGLSFATEHDHMTLQKFMYDGLGDMAEGGLESAHIDDKSLNYSTSMTYFDFVYGAFANRQVGNPVAFQEFGNDFGNIESGHHASHYTAALHHIAPPNPTPVFDGIAAFNLSDTDDSYWARDYQATTPAQICLKNIMLEEEKAHAKTGYTADEYAALGQKIRLRCLAKK